MRSRLLPPAAACLAASLSAGSAAIAQADSASGRTPVVQTAATIERSVRPDVAILTLTFSATGRSPTAAGEALASRADSIRRALQTLGIPHDSLISGSRWYWWRGRVEVVVGTAHLVELPPDPRGMRGARTTVDTSYRATDAIEVHVHDLKRVGAVIDSALAHAITGISPIQFKATDVSEAQEAALREATERARRQAAAIAEASGGKLGRVISLTTERQGYDFSFPGIEAASVNQSAAPGTEVIEPSVQVRVTVYGKWELVTRP